MPRKQRASETTTENIFRSFYGSQAFIEKSAIDPKYGFVSKNGTENGGYPDFFRDRTGDEYAIVVEAKATSLAAAEEDILHYMRVNAVTKDLVGMAVAGQVASDLKVSYFYKNGDSTDIVRIEGVKNALLGTADLEKLRHRARYGDKTTTESLIAVLQSLNRTLHKDGKVRSTDRSLFFSGMMIALNNSNFRNTYKNIQAPSSEDTSSTQATVLEAHHLNSAIVNAIDLQLSAKINSLSKEFSWKDTFSFIRNVDYPLLDYKEIIGTIESEIFGPFKNDEKQDILGRAYKIFLSRAGKAETKNIILTPDHIKSLMVKLADLGLNDVVLDTCTGSGGFLMESMEVLISKADGDPAKTKHIKEKQLIGFELDSVLFSLACSNMFLHGDGKTNLLFRSSLLQHGKDGNLTEKDAVLLRYVKSLGPTKAIINPPYESNGSIRFVKQALEYLNANGQLIVLMPVPTLVLNQGGLTDEILKQARLDFVIKMPDNLFSEQQRGVCTAIFGFTKTPHKQDWEVLFYNLGDDGFVSIQHKGKLDKHNAWPTTEANILRSVQGKNEVSGVAVKRKIYTSDGVLQCTGVQDKSSSVGGYRLVRVDDLFDIAKGTLASGQAVDAGDIDFITAAEEWKKHDSHTHDCEALVYATGASGSLGRCHHVNGRFVASNLCLVLTPKKRADHALALNLQFYAHYFSLIRQKVVSALAAGTSKKTINQTAFADYYIEYVPYEEQTRFLQQDVARLNELRARLQDLESSVLAELKAQEAMFHRYEGR